MKKRIGSKIVCGAGIIVALSVAYLVSARAFCLRYQHFSMRNGHTDIWWEIPDSPLNRALAWIYSPVLNTDRAEWH